MLPSKLSFGHNSGFSVSSPVLDEPSTTGPCSVCINLSCRLASKDSWGRDSCNKKGITNNQNIRGSQKFQPILLF